MDSSSINSPLQEQSQPKKKEVDINELMIKLEKEGMEKTAQLNNKQIDDPHVMMEKLTNIIKEGGKEFKENTGRNMTYSEMRRMYG